METGKSNIVESNRYEIIAEFFNINIADKNGIIVDCACGNGDRTKNLIKAGYQVFGVDIDKRKVRLARTHGMQATQGSILDIPFPDKTAISVVSSETLEHLTPENSIIAANELKRICKPSGFIAITVPADRRHCLKNRLHKQYLSLLDLQKHFLDCELVFDTISYKKINKASQIAIFKMPDND